MTTLTGFLGSSPKPVGEQKFKHKYNLDGSLIESFENLTLASKTIDVRKQDICRACWNVNHTLGGYLWTYENTESFIPGHDNRKKEVIFFK